ncbi:hypothetical protein M5D96_008587 [Drosophila gunungcola]|uniref:HTH CENPB-type domain-containing protein n=1 Tax=Drosophila gunungcola TaxID=103775 RepID=A0A9P9YKJ4_9MUSC|nr:hypothetical protein M5D96_008587 [Drosophila gunungcola]
MDMLPRRPRKPKKRLNLEEKMEVIRTHEQNKLTVRDLAKRCGGIPLASKGAQIDELCFDWFSRARVDNIAISGEMVREKAKQIAEEVGHDGFLASSGWLQKWRIRHNIAYNATGDSLELQEFEAVLVKSEPISNRDDDDEPSPVQLLGPIISIDEAMIQLARLKEFARDDFVSYQQLLSLENQWSWKWNNFKKEVP